MATATRSESALWLSGSARYRRLPCRDNTLVPGRGGLGGGESEEEPWAAEAPAGKEQAQHTRPTLHCARAGGSGGLLVTVALRWEKRETEELQRAGASTPFAASAQSDICQKGWLLSAPALAEPTRVCGPLPGQGTSATVGPFCHIDGDKSLDTD